MSLTYAPTNHTTPPTTLPSGNKFTGALPPSLAKLHKLDSLQLGDNLFNNQLIGTRRYLRMGVHVKVCIRIYVWVRNGMYRYPHVAIRMGTYGYVWVRRCKTRTCAVSVSVSVSVRHVGPEPSDRPVVILTATYMELFSNLASNPTHRRP